MSHRPQTIEDIGLKEHIVSMDIDYALFERLALAGLSSTAIGKVVGKDRRTIGKWLAIWRKSKRGPSDAPK